MTIWERAILSMQKGYQRLTVAAGFFAERMRSEIDLVRLRIRLDEVQARKDELYQSIGRKLTDLRKERKLPKTAEQLFHDEDIAVALQELESRDLEIEDLKQDIKNAQDLFKSSKYPEDKTV